MPIYLKQSTASQEIPLGYFVDSANGNDEETGLSIANTDIKLWKTGATSLANKNSGGATHISNGVYYCVLDATDTNTLGSLVVFIHVAGALAVRVECVVLAANVYDSLIGGGDVLDVSLTQIAGDTDSQVYLKDFVDNGYDETTNSVAAVVTVQSVSGNVGGVAGNVAGNVLGTVAGVDGDVTGNVDGTIGGFTLAAKNELRETAALAAATIGSTGNDTTHIHLANLTYGDDEINDYLLLIYDNSEGEYHARWIADWVNATELATVVTLPFTPQNAVDKYYLMPMRKPLTAAEVNAEVDTALSDYDAPTNAELVSEINAVQADIAALNDLSAAEVNAEVVDALATDTYAEPGQGTPAATTSLAAKINYVYKAWRNRSTQTASQYSLYNDDATTVDQKAATSDDATTFNRGEIATGP